MKLYRPVKSNQNNQAFGENATPIYKQLGMKGHSGWDWHAWHGEPVYHSGDWDGVAYTENDQHGGIGVDVINKELGYKLRYWHLDRVNVYDGEPVKFGKVVGWADNTGLSTGTHLHWGLKEVDANGRSLNLNNGYYGGIDPEPFFENTFVLDVLSIKQKQLTIIQLLTKLLALLKSRKNR